MLAQGPVQDLRVGDLVAFSMAGAYAWNISHHDFLMHPQPTFHYLDALAWTVERTGMAGEQIAAYLRQNGVTVHLVTSTAPRHLIVFLEANLGQQEFAEYLMREDDMLRRLPAWSGSRPGGSGLMRSAEFAGWDARWFAFFQVRAWVLGSMRRALMGIVGGVGHPS
jgi:hypothetical protein